MPLRGDYFYRFLTMKIKGASFNAWDGYDYSEQRWPFIYQNLKELSPNFIGFQEVYHPFRLEKIVDHLGGSFIFSSENCGLSFYSSYPIEKTHLIYFHSQDPTENILRAVLHIVVTIENQKFDFLVTHLSWKKEALLVRKKQIKEIIYYIQRNCHADIKILCGDFNDVPDSPIMTPLQNDQWKDVFQELNPGQDGYTWSFSNPYIKHREQLPQRRVDMIWLHHLNQKIHPQKSEIFMNTPNDQGFYPSDHFGVWAEFEFDACVDVFSEH